MGDKGDAVGGTGEIIRNSELINAKDDITSLENNSTTAPAYRDLDFLHYIKYDTIEYIGKAKKYKQDIVRNCERIRKLQNDVLKLKDIFEKDSEEFEIYTKQLDDAQAVLAQNQSILKEQQAKKDEILRELIAQKRHRDNVQKTKKVLSNEISTLKSKIANLQGEVNRNHKKWEEATSEKVKLNLESKWFNQERIILEQTIEHEKADFDRIKKEIDSIRLTLQNSWVDSKLDVLGMLRATKSRPGEEDWYAVRTRTLSSKK